MKNHHLTPMDSPKSGLSVRNIGKKYGNIEVLSAVSFGIQPGEVVALLGENGAGKSTISSIIAGIIPSSAGSMIWNDKPYAPKSPKDAMNVGIGIIHQEMSLLAELSVAENIFIGRMPMKNGRVDYQTMNNLAQAQLDKLGVNVRAKEPIKNLTIATQQQVEISKALMLNSKLLILDEPTTALGNEETQNLFDQIKALKSGGVSFIYISHRLEEIEQIADRIIVLRDGQLVASHETAKLDVKLLVEDMVGRKIERIFPKIDPPKSKKILEIKGLSVSGTNIKNINFDVKEGEIFGIAGIVGAGRSELVRTIAGADKAQSGNIILDGKKVKIKSVSDAINLGIVMVPEDRKRQGLILDHSIQDNLSYGNFDILAPNGWVFAKNITSFIGDCIQKMQIKGIAKQKVSDLSGGNQQKVVIGKWISKSPKVFILDEPTRGIDVGARAMIYEIIKDLAHLGMAVIVVSSDLEEVLGLSHRIMVMAHKRQQGILESSDISHVNVMQLAIN